MFKTFLTLAFCSTLTTAFALGEEAVVIRLARGGSVEAVFTASSMEQGAGELRLTDPRLYLPDQEKEGGFGASQVGSWQAYTAAHPEEVALWRASHCRLLVSSDFTRGELSLENVSLMRWSGDVVLEMGYGKRRSVFRALEVNLAGDRVAIPGPFVWSSQNWTLSGSRALGRLAHDAQGRPLRSIASLVLEGKTHARGLISLPSLEPTDFTLTSLGTLVASVTDDKVGFRGAGSVEGQEKFMRVTGDDPRGLLGPTGWHYLELENPRAHYEGLDMPGGVELWGRYLYMEPRQVEISGNPVGMEGPQMILDCAGVRWDRVAGRIHCDAPHIRRKKIIPKESKP